MHKRAEHARASAGTCSCCRTWSSGACTPRSTPTPTAARASREPPVSCRSTSAQPRSRRAPITHGRWKAPTTSASPAPALTREDWPLEEIVCGIAATDGVLYLRSQVSVADIGDGSSHTLAVGERSLYNPTEMWTLGAVWYRAGGSHDAQSAFASAATKHVVWPINALESRRVYYVRDSDAPPELAQGAEQRTGVRQPCTPAAPTSPTPTAASTFLDEAIDLAVYRELATPATAKRRAPWRRSRRAFRAPASASSSAAGQHRRAAASDGRRLRRCPPRRAASRRSRVATVSAIASSAALAYGRTPKCS